MRRSRLVWIVAAVLVVAAAVVWAAAAFLGGRGNPGGAGSADDCRQQVDAFAEAVADTAGSDREWSARVAATVVPELRGGVSAMPRDEMPTDPRPAQLVGVDDGVCAATVGFGSGLSWHVEAERRGDQRVWLVSGWLPAGGETVT